VNAARPRNGLTAQLSKARSSPLCDRLVLDADSFQRALSLERRRTERSRKPFLLMLIEASDVTRSEGNSRVLDKVLLSLQAVTRATDVLGWYKQSSVAGVLLTEIVTEHPNSAISVMRARVSEKLSCALGPQWFNQIKITSHIFPEPRDGSTPEGRDPMLYPDFSDVEDRRKYRFVVKRIIDVVGSVIGLLLGAPIFLIVSALIKFTSKGPVFFRQQRIGQHGKPFMFLKFRTMYINNDHSLHKAFVKKLISGEVDLNANGKISGNGAYKITSDPRITRVGSFLRKTSIDELPQLINVLKGDMSLVGPRPPIAYEVEHYDIWHRGRLLEAKPGITGLWQVSGRSRVKFDEMVRLDIRYARSWSVWLDLKILLRTPHAVVLGEGAY
jgi:lipopolysaccharide/colanic/teichoic acid biosynthesis glycosyltransferase